MFCGAEFDLRERLGVIPPKYVAEGGSDNVWDLCGYGFKVDYVEIPCGVEARRHLGCRSAERFICRMVLWCNFEEWLRFNVRC